MSWRTTGMRFTPDDLKVCEADLHDAERRLAFCRASEVSPEQVREAERWVSAARELRAKVRAGLGQQNIKEAASILGATVTGVRRVAR